MAPILSFTAEEVWQASPAFEGKPKSIFLTDLPAPNSKWEDQALSERWERFFTMRGLVTKALELARAGKFLGNSLEAKVVIEAKKDQQQFLQSFGTSLPDLFIVSEVEFGKAKGNWTHTSDEVAGFKVGVEKATGKKCGRCWKYLSSVGSNAKNPDVCERCAHVLQI